MVRFGGVTEEAELYLGMLPNGLSTDLLCADKETSKDSSLIT